MKKFLAIGLILAFTMSNIVNAENTSNNGSIPLSELVASFSRSTGLKVIASEDVKGAINLYGLSPEQVDYEQLLVILKLNGYTAFKTQKYVEIVPGHRARVYTSERANKTKDYPADQYLMEIIKVKNLCAASLMPILKPLVFKDSFIEPHYESNSVVIIDYYSNIKMIRDIVNELDSSFNKQKKCEKVEMFRNNNKPKA